MAKKSKKIEKETRRLIESITDIIKRKDGAYKIKSKSKKVVRRIKRTCVHWIIRKGKEVPTIVHDPDRPDHWKCAICGASFPIKPAENEEYNMASDKLLEYINQIQFWSVKMGGDASDTKLFLALKQQIPRFKRISANVLKRVNKREEWESRKRKTDQRTQFSSYAGYNYRV